MDCRSWLAAFSSLTNCLSWRAMEAGNGGLRWAEGFCEAAIISTFSPEEGRYPHFSIVPHVDIRFPYRHSLW